MCYFDGICFEKKYFREMFCNILLCGCLTKRFMMYFTGYFTHFYILYILAIGFNSSTYFTMLYTLFHTNSQHRFADEAEPRRLARGPAQGPPGRHWAVRDTVGARAGAVTATVTALVSDHDVPARSL